MLSTSGIHPSRSTSQKLHPSFHHHSRGEASEWNTACHSANSSIAFDAPYYSSPSRSASITLTTVGQPGNPTTLTSSPYAYSPGQTPTPTPSSFASPPSAGRSPGPSSLPSSSLPSSSTQGSLKPTSRPPSLELTAPPVGDECPSDEDSFYYSSYLRSSNPPKLSPRLQALHAQLGTTPSRPQLRPDMASRPSGSENPKSPRGRIFAGWLNGKPAPDSFSPTGIGPEEGGPLSPSLTSHSLASPGLSPDKANRKPGAPRRLSIGSNTASTAPSESGTPRNQSPAVQNPKRLSLLQSSISALTRLAAPVPSSEDKADAISDVEDDLLHLDIEAALYPGCSPTDTFSPAAYKNLQMNALGLLQKLHSAYRSRTLAMRALEAERDAQKEDLIEARARGLRLKQQVESMTKQAAEQERSMMELMNELAAEKRARIDEKDEREKNLNVVPETAESFREGSFTEDLGVDEVERARKWRKSAGTIRSDISFDTDEESIEADSVFSRSRSPTIPSAVPSETTSTTPIQTKAPPLAPPRARSSLQMSAFHKILKGMTKPEEEDACRNCRGQSSSVAWDTVSLLRDENKALKSRVGELEVAVESAMDIVNGVGM